MLLITTSIANATEPKLVDSILAKDLLRLEVQVNESAHTQTQSALTSIEFPNTRPEGLAKSLSLTSFTAPYDLFIWQQAGHLFGEAVPTSSVAIYICSSSWILVQSHNNFMSAFNSVRFANSDGGTVCENHAQPLIFQITQWEFLYDVLVDFTKPFNMIENQNADLAVLINGGVSTSSTAAAEKGSIAENLNINIPSIDYQTAAGAREVFLEMIYNGASADGSLTWKLGNAGFKD